ncbi:carbohydrate ABC transporter permease [Paenibacillus sp. VCA1]|uniref:carbohydrate ABC transporter permease n=1 Tax=Paenibacillus sp. VCA1 TaxID=3039148 RepID=UPI0028716322|nr:carbohydrate ABC transporter permease [Paenibacillus sp. VCA1]MDR9855725.1 carbohydrate ABC transporter permease [Paenibacillus sp. VCA1]
MSASAIIRLKTWSWRVFRTVMLTGIAYVILYPILLKVSLALRGRADIYDQTIIWFPKHATFDNFLFVIDRMKYWEALLNTVSLSAMAAILQTAACALAGYGFARLKYKGQSILFLLVIFTIIVPPQTIMIPTYLHFRYFDLFGLVELFTGKPGVNLLDTKWPFILTSLTATGLKNGLYIYIFRQFFRSLPNELEEASLVDGAGVFKTFYRVMLPNALPAIVTVVLFSFVWQYNDSFYVSMYLMETKVLSMQLAALPGLLAADAPDHALTSIRLNAGTVLVIIPIVIFYLLLQKQFVESVERSGIVG